MSSKISIEWCLVCLMSMFVSAAQIELPDKPEPWESTAADELNSYLPRIVREFTLAGKPLGTIHVGDTAFAASSGLSSDKLPTDKWVIRSVENDLILIGGGTRGTIYATSKFLEDVLGCRFFTEGEEYIPEAGDYSFDKLDLEGKPFFDSRCLYYYRLPKNKGRYLAMRLLNIGRIDMAYGGNAATAPVYMHNMISYYMPQEKYFTDHPEYYCLHKGERKPIQLCLSNKDMRLEFIKNLTALVDKTNERTTRAGLPKVMRYNIAQEDGGAACSCGECSAFAEKHGHSGLLVDFLNEVSAGLVKLDPELMINTYAYVYSSRPPTGDIKAADNIVFRVCNTHSSNHLTGESMQFPGMLEGWNKVASRLAVHEYGQLFTFLPEFPWANEFSFPVIARLWADNGVTGVYNELSNDWSADFTVMKFYLFSKLLEDPSREDFDALMGDFCLTYYGAAGEDMLGFRREIKQLSDKSDSKISWMCSATTGHARYIDIDAMVKFQALFDGAEAKVADDPVRFARVRRDRQGLDWTLGFYLFRHYQDQWSKRHPDEDFPFDLKFIRKRAADNYKVDMRAEEQAGAKPRQRCTQAVAILDHNPQITPSPRFKDVVHVDQSPFEIKGGAVVTDAESETGFAVYCKNDRIAAGIYNVMRAKNFFGMTFDDFSPEAIKGSGYNWYKIAEGRLTDRGTGSNLILSSSWSLQLSLAHLEIDYARPIEIWAHFKVAGPAYKIANESGKDELWLDRVVILNKQTE